MEEKRYWDRIIGYVSENKVDARWILKSNMDNRAHGSLRIVSHPDLKPGYLRAVASFVTSRKPKTNQEKLQAIDDYKIELNELEVYSVDEHIKTTITNHEAPLRELENLFGIKVFE